MATVLQNYVVGLVKRLREEQTALGHRLVSGQVRDIEEYRNLTGRIKGLDEAIEIARDEVNKIETMEDDL